MMQKRKKSGVRRGQKQRLLDFVGSEPFTLCDIKAAIERGELVDLVPRNIDRYIATMCCIGQMKRTGQKRVVNGRKVNVYQVIPDARPQGLPKAPHVPSKPPSTNPTGFTHEKLFDIGRRFGTLAPKDT
jgi:hypothetical protein